jgi:hypothetical protein
MYIKKPASAFAKAGRSALAVFLTRPQADYQIGATAGTLMKTPPAVKQHVLGACRAQRHSGDSMLSK